MLVALNAASTVEWEDLKDKVWIIRLRVETAAYLQDTRFLTRFRLCPPGEGLDKPPRGPHW